MALASRLVMTSRMRAASHTPARSPTGSNFTANFGNAAHVSAIASRQMWARSLGAGDIGTPPPSDELAKLATLEIISAMDAALARICDADSCSSDSAAAATGDLL